MRASVDTAISRFATGTVTATTAVAYTTAGAALIGARTLLDAARSAAGWRRGRGYGSAHDGAPARHTLRIVAGDAEACDQGGTTYVIRYDRTTRYARAALAHEFAHVLLAVIRGVPPPSARLETHTEECAAWALARAITSGDIWTGAATSYREQVLAEHGVPAWARAPRIPAPTWTLLRWLAHPQP